MADNNENNVNDDDDLDFTEADGTEEDTTGINESDAEVNPEDEEVDPMFDMTDTAMDDDDYALANQNTERVKVEKSNGDNEDEEDYSDLPFRERLKKFKTAIDYLKEAENEHTRLAEYKQELDEINTNIDAINEIIANDKKDYAAKEQLKEEQQRRIECANNIAAVYAEADILKATYAKKFPDAGDLNAPSNHVDNKANYKLGHENDQISSANDGQTRRKKSAQQEGQQFDPESQFKNDPLYGHFDDDIIKDYHKVMDQYTAIAKSAIDYHNQFDELFATMRVNFENDTPEAMASGSPRLARLKRQAIQLERDKQKTLKTFQGYKDPFKQLAYEAQSHAEEVTASFMVYNDVVNADPLLRRMEAAGAAQNVKLRLMNFGKDLYNIDQKSIKNIEKGLTDPSKKDTIVNDDLHQKAAGRVGSFWEAVKEKISAAVNHDKQDKVHGDESPEEAKEETKDNENFEQDDKKSSTKESLDNNENAQPGDDEGYTPLGDEDEYDGEETGSGESYDDEESDESYDDDESDESYDDDESDESFDDDESDESFDDDESDESYDDEESDESQDDDESNESYDDEESDESQDDEEFDESFDDDESDESFDDDESDESYDDEESDESQDDDESDESQDDEESDESQDDEESDESQDNSNTRKDANDDEVVRPSYNKIMATYADIIERKGQYESIENVQTELDKIDEYINDFARSAYYDLSNETEPSNRQLKDLAGIKELFGENTFTGEKPENYVKNVIKSATKYSDMMQIGSAIREKISNDVEFKAEVKTINDKRDVKAGALKEILGIKDDKQKVKGENQREGKGLKEGLRDKIKENAENAKSKTNDGKNGPKY